MKVGMLVVAALLLGWMGWHFVISRTPSYNQAQPAAQSVAVPVSAGSSPTTTLTDPAEVFQKAFWKRPTADDKILKAERMEWSDETGVTRWQWHLMVKPSPGLIEYLITNNAFMLARSSKPLTLKNPPAGFPTSAEGYGIFTNAAGNFVLLWSESENLLHATDSGSGFRPGGSPPAPPVPASPSQPKGRLSTKLPPDP